MTRYQVTKTDPIDCNRSRILRALYPDQWIVSVDPYEAGTGQLNVEPLRVRGYAGVNTLTTVPYGSLYGRTRWFLVVATEQDADAEIDALCETGI